MALSGPESQQQQLFPSEGEADNFILASALWALASQLNTQLQKLTFLATHC